MDRAGADLACRSRASTIPGAIIQDCCGLLDALAIPIGRLEGANIATVAIARRLLARSFHILTLLEAQKASEKVITGRARVFAGACNTAVELTEQPGVRTPPSCGPTFGGPNGCMGANSATSSGPSPPHDPVPQPTPPPANPSPPAGHPFMPLTGPDHMGAQTAPASTQRTIRPCLVNSRSGFESLPPGPNQQMRSVGSGSLRTASAWGTR
jgi:hypothetical protein